MPLPPAADALEASLQNLNPKLSQKFEADILLLCSPIVPGVDYAIMEELEANIKHSQLKEKLVVALDTPGGSIETTERIVTILRKHYGIVEFAIPNQAYSAGTILAMSGDAIHMDYNSVLGPIDPQFTRDGVNWGSGVGYLEKYEELREILNDPDNNSPKEAEALLLVNKFDPVLLYEIESSIKLCVELLEKWLPQYKFKDWLVDSEGNQVTEERKQERAVAIARVLGDRERWRSHGTGIGMHDLTGDDIKLRIADFGQDVEKSDLLKTYYSTTMQLMDQDDLFGIIQTETRLRRLS